MSSNNTSFEEQISKLEKEVANISDGGSSFSASLTKGNILIICGALTPFIIAILLYSIRPKFVLQQVTPTTPGSKPPINHKKVWQWALGISIVIWICMFVYSFYGSSIGSLISSSKS